MVFHKYRLICTGIPKNASSSIFDILNNRTDQSHDHFTILQDFQNNDSDLMESYTSFCVVRNPYDRFFSACEQIKRDDSKNFGKTTKEVIYQEVIGVYHVNEVFIPQYRFVTFGNKILIENILSYENLEEDWNNFATNYNKNSLFKIRTALPKSNKTEERIPWQEEIKTLTQEELDYINHFYEKDFKLFNYEMIEEL